MTVHKDGEMNGNNTDAASTSHTKQCGDIHQRSPPCRFHYRRTGCLEAAAATIHDNGSLLIQGHILCLCELNPHVVDRSVQNICSSATLTSYHHDHTDLQWLKARLKFKPCSSPAPCEAVNSSSRLPMKHLLVF